MTTRFQVDSRNLYLEDNIVHQRYTFLQFLTVLIYSREPTVRESELWTGGAREGRPQGSRVWWGTRMGVENFAAGMTFNY